MNEKIDKYDTLLEKLNSEEANKDLEKREKLNFQVSRDKKFTLFYLLEIEKVKCNKDNLYHAIYEDRTQKTVSVKKVYFFAPMLLQKELEEMLRQNIRCCLVKSKGNMLSANNNIYLDITVVW